MFEVDSCVDLTTEIKASAAEVPFRSLISLSSSSTLRLITLSTSTLITTTTLETVDIYVIILSMSHVLQGQSVDSRNLLVLGEESIDRHTDPRDQLGHGDVVPQLLGVLCANDAQELWVDLVKP